MNENRTYRRSDIYLANLDPYIGSEQGGTRPVLVLQNNAGNYFCPTLIVASLTSRFHKRPIFLPTAHLKMWIALQNHPSFYLNRSKPSTRGELKSTWARSAASR